MLNRLRVKRPAATSSAIDKRDLRGGKRRAEPGRGLGAGGLARLALQCRRQVGPRRVDGREQAEEQARADRQRSRKQQHFRVERQLNELLRVVGQDRDDQIQRPSRDHQAGDAAEHRQDQRFGEQLHDELPPARAKRQPHRHLGGTRGRARQQQVRDVRAGDDQHQAGHAEQERQRAPGFAADRALPAQAGGHAQLARPEALHRLLAHPRLQRRVDVVDECLVGRVDAGRGLLDRDARFQPSEDVRPVAAAILEALEARLHQRAKRDRHEHLGLRAQRRAVEPARRDADDGQALSVDDQRVVQDRRVEAEALLPVVEAEHDDARFADHAVVALREQPAEGRLHAKHREVAPRHEHARARQGLPLVGEVGPENAVRGQAGEDGLRLFEVTEHRVAEDLVAVARLVARVAARLGAGRREVHQLFRGTHRERPQQHLVEQREDGRRRPDPERQRDDGDHGDKGRAEQRAEGEFEVSHKTWG